MIASIVVASVTVAVGVSIFAVMEPIGETLAPAGSVASEVNATMWTTIYTSYPLLIITGFVAVGALIILVVASSKSLRIKVVRR